MPVRIYDISKKLGLENKQIIAKAKSLGIAAARVASSSLDKITAEFLEEELFKEYPELAKKIAAPKVAKTPKPVRVEEKVAEAVESLAAIPGISREQADALVHAGLTRIEDLLSADESDLSSIPQIGDKAAEILKAAHAEAENRKIQLGGNESATAVA